MEFGKLTAVGYGEERTAYREFADKTIEERDADFVTNKIARHFKLRQLYVVKRGNNDSGRASSNGVMRVSHNPSWLTLAHEVNHFLCWKKYGYRNASGNKIVRHGTRKWNKELRRILRYIQKKNFWEQELAERKQRIEEASKPKPEPTVSEIRAKKIEKAEQKIKRYESKIKMYQTKLKKAIRSMNALKRNQQKQI
jgi:hypothetical protein